MQRNHLENARDFLNFYESTEMQNFGVNVFLLKFMEQHNILKHENLNEFIESHRKTLSETSFKTFITNSSFSFSTFLDSIDPEKKILVNYTQFPVLAECIAEILHGENYLTIGRSSALYFDTKLLSYSDDIHQRVGSTNNDIATDLYLLDNHFIEWPINQIMDYPIYASMGLVENDPQFDPSGFFYELINDDNHNSSNIQYIVALGNSNIDFSPYFITPKKYEIALQDDNKIVIEVDPTPANANTNANNDDSMSDTYHLRCKLTRYEGSNIKSTTEKTIKLFHINIQDGQSFDLQTYGLEQIHDELSSALDNNKGILVHCHAGLGRTGQMITQLIALRQNHMESLFNTYDHQTILLNICQFVNKMRECRPGLIITPEQLFQALDNVILYQQAKQLTKEHELNTDEKSSHQLVETTTSKAQEPETQERLFFGNSQNFWGSRPKTPESDSSTPQMNNRKNISEEVRAIRSPG